jgi:putative membrane protein
VNVRTTSSRAPADRPDLAGAQWHRLHPITPALRGWKTFVALLAIATYRAADQLQNASQYVSHGHLVQVLAVIGAVVVAASAYATVAWRVTTYTVTDEAVHLNTGVLFRQHRQARLDRLQAVDVVQPLLARLMGLAELKLDVAGGSGSSVRLSFLREADALALRAELLALAAGLQRPGSQVPAVADVATPQEPSATGAAPEPVLSGLPGPMATDHAPAQLPLPAPAVFEEAPEQQVYEVPMPRLVAATLRSAATVAFVVLAAVLVLTVVLTRQVQSAFTLVAPVIGAVSVLWARVNQGAGFRAAISPDGIRLRHGLTVARTQTVPPGRVQAIRLSQPLWWRGRDWWRVEINVAGYSQSRERQEETVLHPVATRAEAMTAVWLVLPDLGVGDPASVIDAALSGKDQEGGFTSSPRRARWVDPIRWRRNGVLVTERALIERSGRLHRQVDVVPHERTQSLGLLQGPVQRRLRLATFVVHSTPGPVSPEVRHLDEHVAAALLDEQASRARTARAVASPEQWMRTVTEGRA